ncbi:YcaO-like family protein [Pigmentibacter sp. JX0631]|uniref:YcaO-like family protein n=1 Tax=Pigmentibacter sp. JX0631 TaxID=2976982 RepID=UPI002469AABA|nr:YcaO-like family protein [Pigmentibacter sp. JX0631]WGL60679.1 YcaO-like family protein [Pigmentibacter sp. JX0631]
MFKENGFLIEENLFFQNKCDEIVENMKTYLKEKYSNMSVLFHADLIVPEISEMLHDHKLTTIINEVMQNTSILVSSGYYAKGSETSTHYESIRLSSLPSNKLIGVWIALDDILPTNGPFFYFPKSHIKNYLMLHERINIYNKEKESVNNFIDSQIEEDISDFNLKDKIRKIFLAKKGDVFISDGNLLHGGHQIFNYKLERPSLVGYYLPKNENKYFYPDYLDTKKERTSASPREDITPFAIFKNKNKNEAQTLTPERVFSTENAIENVYNFLKKNNFKLELNSVGNDIVSYESILYHDKYKVIEGYGKGLTQKQSMASSLFEAIEHIICRGDLMDTSNTINVSIEDALKNYNCFPLNTLEKNIKNKQPILWDIFDGINTSEKLIVPSFIVDSSGGSRSMQSNYPYHELEGAYSNSGTATGSTFDEALLHSLNELIERDAHSLLLLETFCRKVPKNLRIIDKKTIPEQQLDLLMRCEDEIGAEIKLLNITTNLNIPCILSFSENMGLLQYPFIGCGCSPSATYALERSILETVQTYHAYIRNPEEYVNYIKNSENQFKEFPKLKECVKEKYHEIIKKGYFTTSNFRELNDLSKNLFNITENINDFSVNHLLKNIIQILSNNKMNVYVKTLFHNEIHNLFCVKSIVRELEIFNLVTSGLFPLPGVRGELALN